MVCSETGIPGGSFAALGAFDPFSVLDQAAYELAFGAISVYGSEYEANFEAEQAQRLTAGGYDKSEVQAVIKEKYSADARTRLIALEYNGLIENTLHDDVRFEVVLNTYDLLARFPAENGVDGSACAHISRSCDIRWLCFPGTPHFTLGHSSTEYSYHAASEFVVGWGDCADATGDKDLIHLPGTAKNDACASCRTDAFCTSNKCSLDDNVCFGTAAGSMPTFCPDGTTRGPCSDSTVCVSGRCELAVSLFDPLGGACYDKLENGSLCNEHTDCLSGNCNFVFLCS